LNQPRDPYDMTLYNISPPVKLMDISTGKRILTFILEDYVLRVPRKCACNAICFMLANLDAHIEVTTRK